MKKGYATTIGNFDGLHKGHMALIEKIKTQAKKMDLKTKIITFNPYPFEFFKLEKNRILSELDKNIILSDLKIDNVNVINFNDHFRNTSAKDFFTRFCARMARTHRGRYDAVQLETAVHHVDAETVHEHSFMEGTARR